MVLPGAPTRVLVWCFLLTLQPPGMAGPLRVQQEQARLSWTGQTSELLLPVHNEGASSMTARIRLEVLDPEDKPRFTAEETRRLQSGLNEIAIPLLVSTDSLTKKERSQLLWYRVRYQIVPEVRAQEDGVEGILALAQIVPDIYELKIIAPGRMAAGRDYRAWIYAYHPITLRPVEGVRIDATASADASEAASAMKSAGVTSQEGYAVLDFHLREETSADSVTLHASARLQGPPKEAEVELRIDRDAEILLATDKALYQPGQTLHLRAIAFDSAKRAIAGSSIDFKIFDLQNTTVFAASARTSRFGVAAIDWPIPDNARLGPYAIQASLADDRGRGSEVQQVLVSRYELPGFSVTVVKDRNFYLPGQSVRVMVKGQPKTEEVIPLAALKESINKAAYGYTDKHVGPKEEVGNKGGSLSNRLRAALNA